MINFWGLKNCDTCRKAKKWLEQNDIAYEFKDVRGSELSEGVIKGWLEKVNLDTLINRRGTTWRNLSEAQKQALTHDTAPALLADYPAVMKRPIFEVGDAVYVGFAEDVQNKLK